MRKRRWKKSIHDCLLMMGAKLPEKLFLSRLYAHDIALFALLHFYSPANGVVCMTFEELKKHLKMHKTTILLSIQRLQEEGLLKAVRYPFVYKEGVVRNIYSVRNCYRLHTAKKDDPSIPVEEILSKDLSAGAKGLLLTITYLSNQFGDTYMFKGDMLSRFSRKPYTAFKELQNKKLISLTPVGVKIEDPQILDFLSKYHHNLIGIGY